MKRAIGVAALGGGLLALSAGAASAQDVSADATARLGRPTSAEVRVCADGQVLSRLLGCTDRAGGAVQAGRAGDGSGAIRARVRVPRAADADVSIGTRRGRPSTTASGQASAARRARAAAAADTSPSADATASLSRLRAGQLLEVGALDGLAGETPAGIGVLESGPIASGNQVDVDAGDVSPSVPVTVCGNSVGVLGDASAACAPAQPSTSGSGGTGSAGASAGTGSSSSGSLLDSLASGNQVDAGIGDISPSVPVTVCGNSAGVLGDASASCGAGGTSAGPAASGSAGASAGTSGTLPDGIGSGNQVEASVDDISATVPVTACGNSAGLLGDASASCGAGGGTTTPGSGSGVDLDTILDTVLGVATSTDGATILDTVLATVLDTSTGGTTDPGTGVDVGVGGDISTGGIIAPAPPGTTPGTTPGRTDTVGTPGSGSTGTSGIPGALGLTPGGAGATTAFAPLRGSVSGSGALPFTGAGSDGMALMAAGLLAAGALFVRATRPAAATEGGGDR
jgi:hypothetical protein